MNERKSRWGKEGKRKEILRRDCIILAQAMYELMQIHIYPIQTLHYSQVPNFARLTKSYTLEAFCAAGFEVYRFTGLPYIGIFQPLCFTLKSNVHPDPDTTTHQFDNFVAIDPIATTSHVVPLQGYQASPQSPIPISFPWNQCPFKSRYHWESERNSIMKWGIGVEYQLG